LIVTGILIRPLKLYQFVYVIAVFIDYRLSERLGRIGFIRLYGNFMGGNPHHGSAPVRFNQHAGIVGAFFFHSRANPRRFGKYQRHRLPLHVGTHEGAVGVIVFQEGNKGSGNRNNLFG